MEKDGVTERMKEAGAEVINGGRGLSSTDMAHRVYMAMQAEAGTYDFHPRTAVDFERMRALRLARALLHFVRGGEVQYFANDTRRWRVTRRPTEDLCMGPLAALRIRQ